jgi:hypothetical protein
MTVRLRDFRPLAPKRSVGILVRVPRGDSNRFKSWYREVELLPFKHDLRMPLCMLLSTNFKMQK